ncbi:hypothetical protein D9M72_475540 [compost metagenome]
MFTVAVNNAGVCAGPQQAPVALFTPNQVGARIPACGINERGVFGLVIVPFS